MSELTIVIVHYNTPDYLERCLQSIEAETRQVEWRVVLVDNASREQHFSPLMQRHPRLECLLNPVNLGFAAGCNRGIRHRPAPFYLLLNPDCVIQEGAIDRVFRFLQERPEAGIVGCRVNNPDGSLQLACRRSIPRPSTAFFRFSQLSRLFPRSRRLARYNLSFIDDHQTHEVEAVSGSFLMFRHQLISQIGLLDESFFLYGEDLDFCYRALQKGWKIYYYPQARIVHHKRRSSSQNVSQSTYHFYQAMELFYRKHFSARASGLEKLVVVSGIRALYLASRLRQRLTGKREVGSGW